MSTEPQDPGAAAAPVHERAGTRIGPYTLLESIGEGGFGVVFLAQQERPVARRVALKIIKLGMDTRQVVARFEQERQALALMDHPNIARVIDAGATETGRPYFVMDYVQGAPISRYCDEHNLTIDERLELFAQVCHAVQHAHGKGIIHRDLKPSNILVTLQDGRAQPKIIDFGIAKATNARLTDMTLQTEQQQVIGTLQYMSPEQAAGSLDIDTRTDVYALGVVLYELVTGSTPFDAETLRDAFYSEIQRMIREVEPPRPSTRISTSYDSIGELAARRRVEPKRLNTLVRGELDWIVMKALEKDRTRRYETAKGFADDVARFRAGEAVLAAPPSARYRVTKFVRRHRLGLATTALLAAALMAGISGTWWGMVQAQRGKADAERQAQNAERERAEAAKQRDEADLRRAEAVSARAQMERVANFQARMLQRVPPFEMGRDLGLDLVQRVRAAQTDLALVADQQARTLASFETAIGGISMTDVARRIIDANVLRPSTAAVAAEFEGEPLTQAALYHTIATIYRDLGLAEKAREAAQRELELRSEQQGAEHPDTLRARALLGDLYWRLGRLDDSGRLFDELVPVLERVLGAEHPDTLFARGCAAVTLMDQSRSDEALASLQALLEVQERVQGPEHADVAGTLGNLGTTLVNLKRENEAVACFERALAIRTHVYGAEDAATLRVQQQLATAYERLRRFDDAYRLRLAAIETLGRIKGANHPATIEAIAELAKLYKAQNRLAEAETQARRALALQRIVLGDAHPQTIDSIGEVGVLCSKLGKYEESETLCVEALQRSEATFGPDAQNTIVRVNNLAVTYWFEGKFAEMEPLFARTLAFNRRAYGEESTETAFALANMGVLLHKLGRVDEEREMLEHALAINLAKLGPDHANTLFCQGCLAVLAMQQREFAEAETAFRELLERERRVIGADHQTTLEAQANLAAALTELGRYDESEPLLVDALERRRRVMGAEKSETLRTQTELIKLYATMQELERARPLLVELIAARGRAAEAPNAPPQALSDLALILLEAPLPELRDPARALPFARRANELTGGEQPVYLSTLALAQEANAAREAAVETLRKALALLPQEAPDRAKLEQRLAALQAH